MKLAEENCKVGEITECLLAFLKKDAIKEVKYCKLRWKNGRNSSLPFLLLNAAACLLLGQRSVL
jgi:hypothetical protein